MSGVCDVWCAVVVWLLMCDVWCLIIAVRCSRFVGCRLRRGVCGLVVCCVLCVV